MNKSQLIEALATRFDGNKKDAQHALESVLDTITRAVASGEKVSITGFGAFEKIDKPSRMVRNPRTGERKRAKKTSVPKFRPGAELKAVVAGQKKLPKLKAGATKAAPTKAAATKATAKKSATKTTGSRTTTKSAAKKSTAKTAKSATKATARKAAPKKTAARKTTATKKSATKKSTAKRTTTKRTAKR